MNPIRRTGRAVRARFAGDAAGYTLAELLVVVSITSVIVVVLGAAFTTAAQTSVSVKTRLNESQDVRLLNAYFVADAAGATSITKAAPACAALAPSLSGATPVASFAWTDSVPKSVYYAASGNTLVRRYCQNGAKTSDVTVTRNLGSATFACEPVNCFGSAAGAGAPSNVVLTVTERSGYSYTVQASPRGTDVAANLDQAPDVRWIRRDSPDPTDAPQVQYQVAFSEAVSGVDTGDFSLVSPPAGAGVAAVIGVGGGTAYTVVVNTGTATTGTVTLQLTNNGTIKDRTGKAVDSPAANASFTGESFTINKSVPAVSAIAVVGNAATNASSVSWTVTFTQPVTGVDVSDFALDVTGLSGPAITAVTAVNTTTWTVTATTGTGPGTLGLTLVDNDSIVNGTRKLGGSGTGNGTFKGAVYTVRGGCGTSCSGPDTQDDNGSSGNNWGNWNNWNWGNWNNSNGNNGNNGNNNGNGNGNN